MKIFMNKIMEPLFSTFVGGIATLPNIFETKKPHQVFPSNIIIYSLKIDCAAIKNNLKLSNQLCI